MSVAAAAPVTSSGAQALKEDWMEEDVRRRGCLCTEGQPGCQRVARLPACYASLGLHPPWPCRT